MTSFADAVYQNGNRPVLGAGGYPADYPGRVYHVNNITGTSTGDGFSWATAMDEISTAITAATAFLATHASGNEYIRNIIYVQATSTNYSPLTALPSYCDMYGIGANVHGNGSGIVKIMDNNSSTDAISHGSSGVRGLYMENFQVGDDVTSGSTGYAMDLAKIFRSTFVNCVFWNKTTGGVRLTLAGGVTFKDCQIGGGDTSNPAKGLENDGSANFNNMLIENCFIHGTTTGLEINAEACNNTIVKNNFIYGGSKGVDDNSVSTSVVQWAYYVGNHVSVNGGGDGFEIAQGEQLKTFANVVNVNGTSVYEDAGI